MDRFNTKVTFAGKLYSSKKAKVVKSYLEEDGLQQWVENNPELNDTSVRSNIESVEVVGSGHEGGTVSSEPFHLDIQVKDKQGKLIKTTNPHTKKATNTWHAYVADDKTDLLDKAKDWKSKKESGNDT